LEKLVKAAFEEGWNERGADQKGYNEDFLDVDWELSETKRLLKEE